MFFLIVKKKKIITCTMLLPVLSFLSDLAPGGSDDWAYDQGIMYSFTFELQDRGQYGFLLPPNLISSACNEAFAGIKTIVLRVLEKLH